MIALVICVNCAIALGGIYLTWRLRNARYTLRSLVNLLTACEQLVADTRARDSGAERFVQGYQMIFRWHQQYHQRVLQLRQLQRWAAFALLGLRLLRSQTVLDLAQKQRRRLPFW